MTNTILLTGFNPFGGGGRNPSGEAVSVVGRRRVGPGKLVTEILRTEFACGGDRLVRLLATHRPAAWIGVGLNQRGAGIALERVAVNLDDARIADNAGNQRQNAIISSEGPPTLPTSLPLQAMHDALSSAGYPTTFSDSPGSSAMTFSTAPATGQISINHKCGAGSYTSPGRAIGSRLRRCRG